jgi:hypothetical protein
MCEGQGTLCDPLYQGQDPVCWLCMGRGWVSLLVDRACGRPAYFNQGDILFCGRKDCFVALTREAWKSFNVRPYNDGRGSTIHRVDCMCPACRADYHAAGHMGGWMGVGDEDLT